MIKWCRVLTSKYVTLCLRRVECPWRNTQLCFFNQSGDLSYCFAQKPAMDKDHSQLREIPFDKIKKRCFNKIKKRERKIVRVCG